MDENSASAMESRPAYKSRIPTHAGSLSEMSLSRTNARSGIIPPGTISGATSKPSGIAKPTKQNAQTAAPSRAASGTTKSHNRNTSLSSSLSSRTSSSRTTSNSSFSATVGPGSQPPSHGNPRPQTSFGFRKAGGSSVPRPATSLDTHDEDTSGSQVLGKRKGMQLSHKSHFHLSPGYYDKYMNYTADWSPRPSRLPVPEASTVRKRDTSLSAMMGNLTLTETQAPVDYTQNPCQTKKQVRNTLHSHVPKALHHSRSCSLVTPSPSPTKHRSPQRHPPRIVPFLTKDSNTKAWDHESRLQDFEQVCDALFARMSQAGQDSYGLKETVELYKSRVNELEATRTQLMDANCSLRVELETLKNKVTAAEEALKAAQREHEIEMDESDRRLRTEAETIRQECQKQIEALAAQHQEELREVRRRYDSELDNERALRQREISQITSQCALDTQRGQLELANKEREIERLERELQAAREDIELEKTKNRDLRKNLDTASSNTVTLESSIRALKARIEFLESGSKEQSEAFARLNQQLADAIAQTNEAKEKLRKEETLRRKLHNQVQELKGNIRVFCRVRPPLPSEPANEIAQISFPDEAADCKEISILGPEEKNSLGVVSRKNNAFSFDRVFGPNTQNADVFEEISQLVQSALDGYNVCIFCYGQTGSGKTYTMSSEDGMIPRAVHQIYDTAKNLEEKGWTYKMEGNFVEVYNENLNDLLGKAEEFDKKKHEIRHDMQRCKTTITDVTTVTLDSPEMVESILRRAAANRSVAATKANERSSRSHSVFILRLLGENSITGERSEGTLNLVDLAGSERLSHSGATGERLKETQSINRSLSCLGDVISALGQGKEGGHIPYRNSKLTYLLQFSLGGNSKTLMFVMVSPLQAHLGETLTSLKFATKVHNTHIGTAKRQTRVRES